MTPVRRHPVRSVAAVAAALTITLSATGRAADAPVVDASTMRGKVMCGYQGWFNTPNDGSGRGVVHWGKAPLGEGDWTVDLLPDVSELDADELFDTQTLDADGKPVKIFSSYNPKTVARHFKWMQQYGIDGVFLQRFVSGLSRPAVMTHYNRIVENVRTGAKSYGRAWGMMYDLSGLKPGGADVVIEDWKHLVSVDKITGDSTYIHENGKPIVVLWGIGFGNEKRPDLFEDGLKLIQFLKSDPVYGNNTVMIGVPHQWRAIVGKNDERAKAFQAVIEAADIIQPWNVGSYKTPEEVQQVAKNKWAPDIAWCEQHHVQYMPVVFPGFTWFNLRKGQAPSDQIPRAGGRFLWQQYVEAKKLGSPWIYQAMFDEVDEGTAIMKVRPAPTPGKSVFVDLHGLPSDFYLRLVGEGGRLMRGEISVDQEPPLLEAKK